MRIPKMSLEAQGFLPKDDGKRELVKLLVIWTSAICESTETVFANYYPRDRRAEVYVGRLKREGEQFRIAEARRYQLADFVRDFNDNRSLNLQNVKLGTDGVAFWMDVDGRRVLFSDCKMTTFGSLVNLSGNLCGDKEEIKFEYDGMLAVARFRGHPLIEFVQIYGDELEIRYAQSKDEKHVCHMNLKNG